MKKRVFAAVLWAYVTWYACNIIGAYVGVAVPGALLGLAAGAIAYSRPIMRAGRAHVASPVSASPSTVSAES